MVEIKVTTVEIPMAESMKNVADTMALRKEKEYNERQKKQIERGWESMPHLINFISSEIQRASYDGCHKIELNLIDDTFKNSRVYKTHIIRSNKILEAQKAGKSIIEYAPSSAVAQAYMELAKEVINDGK